MLVTTAPLAETIGCSGVKMPSTPNASMNQRSLSSARSPEPAIAPAWPTARVSFDFQRPTTQATTGFAEIKAVLVIAAGFGVEHRRLAARIVA